MEGDEDFEDKEINYRKICKDIIGTLNKIKVNLRIFDKFNLPNYQKKDLIETKKSLEKLNYSKYNNPVFIELMDISCQVEDLLKKTSSILGDLMKKSSNKFNSSLIQMSKLIQGIIDKYLSYYQGE